MRLTVLDEHLIRTRPSTLALLVEPSTMLVEPVTLVMWPSFDVIANEPAPTESDQDEPLEAVPKPVEIVPLAPMFERVKVSASSWTIEGTTILPP